MHINKVSIQNLRSIRHFEMEFEQPAGWHVLIGDNGAGKSSILMGMAMGLIGYKYLSKLNLILNRFIHYDSNDAKIIIRHYDNSTSGVVIERSDKYPKISHPNRKNQFLRPNPYRNYSASFGPFRRFTGGNLEGEKPYIDSRFGNHLSIFSEGVALTEALKWLVNLNYKRLEGDDEAATTLESLKTFINEGKLLPHNAKITKVSSDGVFLTDGNGLEVNVNELSDGFRSILSMTFEIIRQMVVYSNADEVFKSIQKGEIKIDVPGVVLIDEVDAHLHPTWQTEIGFWFTKYFPNIQFIVTTHSPLVCRACERGSIWRLAAPGSGEESREITGVEKDRLIIGNILDAYGTKLFGRSPVRSAKSNEKLARLGKLNMRHALGKIKQEEEAERQELQRIFSTDDPTGF